MDLIGQMLFSRGPIRTGEAVFFSGKVLLPFSLGEIATGGFTR